MAQRGTMTISISLRYDKQASPGLAGACAIYEMHNMTSLWKLTPILIKMAQVCSQCMHAGCGEKCSYCKRCQLSSCFLIPQALLLHRPMHTCTYTCGAVALVCLTACILIDLLIY